MRCFPFRRALLCVLTPIAILTFAGANNLAVAGLTFGFDFNTPQWRWDNAPFVHTGTPDGDIERSLDGGLRYSVQGGSLDSFYSMFTWETTPTQGAFDQAISNAFNHWTAVDPVSNFGTSITFTEDFGTPVNTGSSSGSFEFLRLGSEIDLFADGTLGQGAGFAQVSALGVGLQLTSGVNNYLSWAISGADLHLSTSQFNVDEFELLLTHELGHALGLADVEFADDRMIFLDDNYDPTSDATALATLTNSWAAMINPLDPDDIVGSGLSLYTVANGTPGLDSPGVNILMESNNAGGLPAMLHNDDYAMRQFLYPQLSAVPEPSSLALVAIAGLGLAILRRTKRNGTARRDSTADAGRQLP